MKESEYNKLIEEHGEPLTKKMIQVLDNYKGANGKKYKSDYRAILNWVVDKVKGVKNERTTNKVVENLIQANMTDSHSKCPYCKREVPKKEIELFGKKRYVQPVCECVAKKLDEDTKKAADRSREHELKRLFSIHNLGERFNESNFTNFIAREGTEKCFKLAQNMSMSLKHGKASPYCFGVNLVTENPI
jgi:hypothetical protein